VYYAPEADSYLLNNDPDSWLPPSVWEWTGRRISASDEVVVRKRRVARNTPEVAGMMRTMEAWPLAMKAGEIDVYRNPTK
jgi:hypothetical protein